MDKIIKYCIRLSQQRIMLKKAILITNCDKFIVSKAAGQEFNQFNEILNSMNMKVTKIELQISRILKDNFPEFVIPERFYFSSYDIKSKIVSFSDLSGNMKVLSLDTGEISNEDTMDESD